MKHAAHSSLCYFLFSTHSYGKLTFMNLGNEDPASLNTTKLSPEYEEAFQN